MKAVVVRFIKHPFCILLFVNIVAFLSFEGIARILAFQGLIPFKQFPTARERTLLDDINPYFGVWRYPNQSNRHTHACFDVEYKTNELGMRDRARAFDSDATKRVVVLGDSFVEGFGVEAKDRFTDIVEAQTNIEMLNFGTSGDFSSTQQYLVYRELAAKFQHNEVALFLLPSNDFRDNDPKNFVPTRYRPYLRAVGENDFEIYYSVSFEEREMEKPMGEFRRIKRELYNHVYLLNVFRQLGDIFEQSKFKDSLTDPVLSITKTSYDDYSAEDFKKLTWGYRKIAELAAPRLLHIFIIPREVDFVEMEEGKTPNKLVSELNQFAATQPNIRVHDLLPFFIKEIQERKIGQDKIFLPCDGHWSALGHSIAAEALLQRMSL